MFKKLYTLLFTTLFLISTVGCSFTVDQTSSDLDFALQTADAVCLTIGPVLPGEAAACESISQIGIAGINIIKTDYDAYKASGAVGDLAKLKAAIQAVQDNLNQELAALKITSQHAVQVITNWVHIIVSTVLTVLQALPQLTSPSVSVSAKMKLATALPTAQTLKFRWDNEVCQGDEACQKLVTPHDVYSNRVVNLGAKTKRGVVHVVTLGKK